MERKRWKKVIFFPHSYHSKDEIRDIKEFNFYTTLASISFNLILYLSLETNLQHLLLFVCFNMSQNHKSPQLYQGGWNLRDGEVTKDVLPRWRCNLLDALHHKGGQNQCFCKRRDTKSQRNPLSDIISSKHGARFNVLSRYFLGLSIFLFYFKFLLQNREAVI